jgi:hypothetical protein
VEWWYRQNMIIYAPEQVLFNLNLPPAEIVKPVIHPDLFDLKMKTIDFQRDMIEKEVWRPSVKSAFKRLIKSIVR